MKVRVETGWRRDCFWLIHPVNSKSRVKKTREADKDRQELTASGSRSGARAEITDAQSGHGRGVPGCCVGGQHGETSGLRTGRWKSLHQCPKGEKGDLVRVCDMEVRGNGITKNEKRGRRASKKTQKEAVGNYDVEVWFRKERWEEKLQLPNIKTRRAGRRGSSLFPSVCGRTSDSPMRQDQREAASHHTKTTTKDCPINKQQAAFCFPSPHTPPKKLRRAAGYRWIWSSL